MKTKILSLLSIVFFSGLMAFAQTTHTVTVQNFSFSPSTVNAKVGDIIKWNWVNGDHTTTSVSIPAGAAAWDTQINQASSSFSYTLTKAGTYGYKCTPHTPGMVGAIVVSNSTTSVNETTTSLQSKISVFPNPFKSNINIALTKVNASEFPLTAEIFDVLGKKCQSIVINADDVNNGNVQLVLSSLNRGVYILSVSSNTGESTHRIVKAD